MLVRAMDTEVSREFLQGMADRMSASFHKYGPVAAAAGKFDNLASLRERLAKYEETGNTEWLMDVANFAMIEYMYPRHERAHYRATDSNESPGRFDASGQRTTRDNRGDARLPAFHRHEGD